MRVICILTFFLIPYCSIGQTPHVMPQKTLKKGFPGVVPLKDDYLFVDETEVSNDHWKEFLAWLAKNDTVQFNKMLPDTQIWKTKLAFGAPFTNYYFRHPAYANYPVVGITYSQAQTFCQWRSDRVMEYLKAKGSPIKKLQYRLPSEEEWKKAAWGTLPEGSMWPWEGSSVRWIGGKRKHDGLMRFNFKSGSGAIYSLGQGSDGGYITTPVYSYWPNTIGLYNICGNVDEWTEEHKALGGSWNDFGYQCQITTAKSVLHDSTALPNLGFRCVMEVLEYQDEYRIQPVEFTAKFIEKQMKYIPDSNSTNLLFASETEVSNQEYQTFLSQQNSPNHSVQNDLWAKYTRYQAQKLYGSHKAYNQYPVVNIEYQDALAYCNWLTAKYNQMPKRTYQKVQFRLPTLTEWQIAASAGKNSTLYPWGGPYTQNSKGCYLANFSPLEMQYLDSFVPVYYYDSAYKYMIEDGDTIQVGRRKSRTQREVSQDRSFDSSSFGLVYTYPNDDKTISRGVDGSYYPARVDADFPNDYGMYNMAGNVSEMLAEKGKAKGGNWTSSQYQIQINSPTEQYSNANPTLGFRVFMEVLER